MTDNRLLALGRWTHANHETLVAALDEAAERRSLDLYYADATEDRTAHRHAHNDYTRVMEELISALEEEHDGR